MKSDSFCWNHWLAWNFLWFGNEFICHIVPFLLHSSHKSYYFVKCVNIFPKSLGFDKSTRIFMNSVNDFIAKGLLCSNITWNVTDLLTAAVGQCLPLPLIVLAFSDVMITHSRIVSPTYGGTVNSGLELMTGILLSRTSWRLSVHETSRCHYRYTK